MTLLTETYVKALIMRVWKETVHLRNIEVANPALEFSEICTGKNSLCSCCWDRPEVGNLRPLMTFYCVSMTTAEKRKPFFIEITIF